MVLGIVYPIEWNNRTWIKYIYFCLTLDSFLFQMLVSHNYLILLFDCNEEERACCIGILCKTSFKLSNNFLFNDHLCNIHGLIDLKYICSCICWEAYVDPEIFFPQGGPRDICLAMGEGVQGLFLVILL